MVERVRRYTRHASAWGWLAGGVGGLVIVLMLSAPFMLSNVPLDEYGCPETGSIHKTVILLDTSDPLNEKQSADLDVFLGCLMGNIEGGSAVANTMCADTVAVAKYAQLVAYQLPEQGVQPELLESGCNPGNVHSRSISDKLTEGRRFAHTKWERFKLDIYGSFERSKLSSGAAQTPLLEGIQYIASREFSPPNVARRLARARQPEGRLIIISDFIQNSEALNQFEGLGRLPSVLQDYPFSLAAAEIEMRYLKRVAYRRYQTPQHQSWWAEFLNYKAYSVPKAEVW